MAPFAEGGANMIRPYATETLVRRALAVGLAAALSSGLAACATQGVGSTTFREPRGAAGHDARSQRSFDPGPVGVAAPVESEAAVTPVPIAGSSILGAHATVMIDAPVQQVRAVVFDFARYPEFMPRFHACKPMGATSRGGRNVQMELHEMNGAIKLWVRTEISPPRIADHVEAYDGRFLAGNVKDYRVHWQFEDLDGKRTRLTVDSFLDPDLMLVPSSLINEASLSAAKDAIMALKQRVERLDARSATR